MKLTVADLTADSAGIASEVGLCLPGDRARFLQLVNSAQERMLAYGRWWGSIVEMQLCVSEACLVLPREVGTIEQIALCKQPIELNNGWYQFTQNLAKIEDCDTCGSTSSSSSGCGTRTCGPCGHLQARMRQRFVPSFASTRGANKVLRFYPGHSSDVGKVITVQGYDENNIWVRTNPSGTVIDGEQVTLALPFVDTTTVWYPGSPTALIKAATNYRVLMYEVNTVTGGERLLGDYQPTETNPSYRSLFIPHFSKVKCGSSCDSDDCDSLRTVTALVKLAHVPVSADQDWLIFQNLEAYREAILACWHWRNGNSAEGNYHFFGVANPKQARMSNVATINRGGALPLLRAELRSLTGDITTAYVHHENTNSFVNALAGFR